MNLLFHLDQFIRACDGRRFPNQLGILVLTLGCLAVGCSPDGEAPNPAGDGKPAVIKATPLSALALQNNGQWFLKRNQAPFTGLAEDSHPNGQLRWRATFREGQPDGNWDEWEPDGLHVGHREFEAGRLVKESLPEELQERIQTVVQERKELDQTVWKEETAAQQVEAVFTDLWDELRGAKDKFAPLVEFGFSSLSLPEQQSDRTLEWDIIDRQFKLNADTKPLSPAEWKVWLAARKAEGWELIESEWHQEKFAFKKGSDSAADSLFKFTLHVQHETRRVILRGELKVEWLKLEGAQGLHVGELTVDSLRVLERTGAAPFVPKLKIEPARARAGYVAPSLVKDLNGDGRPEIIFAGNNSLLWNRGDWKWERAPLCDHFHDPLSSALLGDFTGDGVVDLFGVSADAGSLLWTANGKGQFPTPPTRMKKRLADLYGASACSAGDVDGDGDLDVWVMQYKQPYTEGQFPTPYYNANDGYPSYLLLNDGRGNFTDATESAGLADKRFRRSYSGSLVDLDGDGDLDLMNVSDFSGLDLYLNDGKGRFTDITATLGEDRFSFGMSHTLGDFNGDGRLDLYMTGMGSTTARRLETMKAGRKDFAGHQDHRMKMGYGNRLFLGEKDGFAQAPYNHQVARAGWSWGVAGADFDLDGDRDLFIANGHLSRDSAKDYCTTFWRHDIYSGNSKSNPVLGEFFVDLHKQLHGGCSWNGFEHNVFYLNLPGEGFVNVAFLLGVSHEFDSRVVVGTDFDADGRPDLLVTQLSARTRGSSELLHLIKNNWETSGSWIGVRLQGRPGISPLGAMVKIKTGDKTLIHPITSGDSLWAQHPAIAHFGLGDLKTVELLEINWGNGKTTRIENPKVNQYHHAQPK